MASTQAVSRASRCACWLPSMKVSYTPVKGWYCESSSRLEERTASGWLTSARKAFRSCVQRGGKRCRQELLLDFGVILALQGKIQQVVLANELIEDIGGQHDRRGHGDADAGESGGSSGSSATGGGQKPGRAPCRPANRRQCAENSIREGWKVSARKSPISTSLCSRRYSSIDSIRSRRRCSGLAKSETFRGRSLSASANSVRAISQWEK